MGGATQVDGLYVNAGGSGSMTGGTINISATEYSYWCIMLQQPGGTVASATLTNLGANFTVASTGTGDPLLVLVQGLEGAKVVVSGTDLDKITSEDGDAYGMWAVTGW
jgi:hypothetical protein